MYGMALFGKQLFNMMKLILILFFLPLFMTAQTVGMIGVNSKARNVLLVFTGESNSGGLAANSSATTSELLARSSLKILNNNSLLFENLHIGVNNQIGHAGFTTAQDTTTHGWELEFANRIDSGTFGINPMYLVKAGQGGSIIANWIIGSAYNDSLFKRMDTAIALLTSLNNSQKPSIYIFYSQGINDANAATNATTWQLATIQHFKDIRNRYGNSIRIFMTNMPTYIGGNYAAYNSAIASIATLLPYVFFIDVSGAGQNGDNLHWSYSGMKLIGSRMIDKMGVY